MKIQITSPALASYTGFLGPIEFVRGLSVDNVSVHDYKRIACSIACEIVMGVPDFIVKPPANLTLTEGESLSLRVVLATSLTSVQWQKDDVDIPDATDTLFEIDSVASGDAGTYKCVATNEAGSETSSGTVITVNAAPIQTGMGEPEPMSVEPQQVSIEPEQSSEPGTQALYTREELEQVADSQGIAGLREIADRHDIRGRSIQELINELLEVRQ
ncbi:immunoglobulin domain-containing protein [Vibrio owensii]|uniref:immunoglobulin domain-containing protein n=1 Tax=Vibrio owensii TaxID=696485 RepID=UPI003393A69E